MGTEKQREWKQGQCIGKGSFGTVSLAYHKLDGRLFAVKSTPLTQPATNEIEILRSLASPFIVSYLGDSATTTHRHLHMEYVPGGTLTDIAGNLDEHDVRAYTRQLLHALFYLHSTGVVHSDVKGRNVLAGPYPAAAKLADFGSARRVYDRCSPVGGTPLWMAPEVVRGEIPTPESDIWSLGCTVIEMVTGEHPWKENNNKTTLFEIGYGHKLPKTPSKLSKLGSDFISKCLCRNPEERWSAVQLLRHPFLESNDEDRQIESRQSPRSVLEWANYEFTDNEEEEDDVTSDSGRGRIRELAKAKNEDLNWESDGWETVRAWSIL